MPTVELAARGAEMRWDDFLRARHGEPRTALAARSAEGWREISYRELREKVEAASADLIERGLRPGDRVAILSESSPEWVVALFALLHGGGIAVPLDAKLSARELACQIENAEPRIVLASPDRAEVADEVVKGIGCVQQVVVMDPGWPGSPLSQGDGETQAAAYPPRYSNDVAVITYTSGTTGSPKGVMTTFGNLLFEVRTCAELFRVTHDDVSLSILPLNHLLELAGSLLIVLSRGGQTCFAGSLFPQDIAGAIRERKVTRMVVVPMFLVLLMRDIERRAGSQAGFGKLAFESAFALARFVPSRPLRRALFSRVHRELGGSLTDFVCGGAPLDPAVARFFERLGLSVFQGYGLTETSPVIATNAPSANRLASVGRPLPGVELRIDGHAGSTLGEGEILTRGPHVMQGYFRRDDLTRDAIDSEGWLHTGDIGRIDSEGYLHVTGRIKDLIVLGGGKKVLPEEVEAQLASPLFAEVCIVGRRAPDGITAGAEEVCAIVVPSAALLTQSVLDHALGDQPACRRTTSRLQDAVEREIERLVHDVAAFKRPTHVFVRLEALPRTSTRKVRKALLRDWLERQTEVGA